VETQVAVQQKEYEELLKANLEAACEAYSTPEHLRDAKLGEF